MKNCGVVAVAAWIFGVLLLTSNFVFAQNACEDLFRQASIFSEQKLEQLKPVKLSKKQSAPINDLIELETSSDSTTGNRSESKYTLTVGAFVQLLLQFKGKIETALPNYKLVVRDPLRDGYKNVTWTGYANRFLAKASSGKDIIVKIRLRKYGHVAESLEITKENFIVLDSLKEISWLELKIENPENESSVVKPRVLIHDSDANLLLSPELSKRDYQEIVERMQVLNKHEDAAVNAKNMESVRLMVKAIRRIHKEGSRLEPESETLYERDSYKVPLVNSKTGQTYEVQMTVDKNVTVTDVATQYRSAIYKQAPVSVAVVEFKYQESLRQLMAAGLLVDVAGLQEIQNFDDNVEGYSIRRHEINKGKLGHLRRDIERELQKDIGKEKNKDKKKKK